MHRKHEAATAPSGPYKPDAAIAGTHLRKYHGGVLVLAIRFLDCS